MRLRFIDVQVTEKSAVDLKQLDPPIGFDLAEGERIAAITERYDYSGTFGHDVTLYARVWIACP